MSPYLAVGLFVVWSGAIFIGGIKYKGNADLAAQNAAIVAEQERHQKAEKEANEHASDLEKELAKERLDKVALNSQLEKAYEKVTNNCPVPPNFIRMLNQAINK